MTDTLKKPVILIVDDTPTNVRVLAEFLHNDYRVRVAPGGQEALEQIERQGPPDLILLDVMMPGMDGYEVCRRLKGNPSTMNIPVIFVTARDDASDEEKGLRLGAADYIVKPFHLPIVAARVHNHIQLKIKTDLLESLAMLDGLTGIPNRRRFDEALEEEWLRSRREKQPLSLIMADIDVFKAFNDLYGHGAGDVCLTRVAAILEQTVARPGDLVARYGGEEFVMLLPNTDLAGAKRVADRFRSQVEAMRQPHAASRAAEWLTVSVGFASVPGTDSSNAASLLAHADRMLYRAKKEGGNRTCGSKVE